MLPEFLVILEDRLMKIVTAFILLFIVDYRPINASLNTVLSGRTVVVNVTFNITCSAQASPAAKYRFYKDQDNFINDTTSGDAAVITTSVSERIKQVNYSCTPFNDFGDGPTEVITLTVLCKYTAYMCIMIIILHQLLSLMKYIRAKVPV